MTTVIEPNAKTGAKLPPMKLPSGSTGFTDDSGRWVCTGSMMGRRDTLPENKQATGKLRLVRLKWRGGDYDEGGAYWGNPGDGSAIYWAKGDLEGEEFTTELFQRAKSRVEVKAIIRKTLPNVSFYR